MPETWAFNVHMEFSKCRWCFVVVIPCFLKYPSLPKGVWAKILYEAYLWQGWEHCRVERFIYYEPGHSVQLFVMKLATVFGLVMRLAVVWCFPWEGWQWCSAISLEFWLHCLFQMCFKLGQLPLPFAYQYTAAACIIGAYINLWCVLWSLFLSVWHNTVKPPEDTPA